MASRQPRGRHGGRTSAKDRALEYVKGQILAGTFAGGELISEGETAAALSMSRTPVREAFLRLEADGLLRLYPQRGALVVPVSPDEIRWVMEARSTVEHYAARNLAHCEPEVRDAVFEELSAQLQRQRDALACADIPGFLDADRAFHHVTVEACDNPILAQFYSTLRDRQMRMVGKSATGDPQRLVGIIAEHGEIADAIHAGEADRATGAVRRHLLSTLRAIGGTPDRVELLGPDETSSTPPR